MNKQGKITPSGFAAMMTNGRRGDEMGKTAIEYANRVALERIGVDLPEVETWSMAHGINWEEVAIQAYIERYGFVQPTGTIQHPELDYIAGTPDGLIGDDGLIEVKCPYNPANHLANLMDGAQIKEYYDQMQGYMWITNRKWCDFVSYDPRFPERLRLYVKRVERDDIRISELAESAAHIETLVKSIIGGLQLC